MGPYHVLSEMRICVCQQLEEDKQQMVFFHRLRTSGIDLWLMENPIKLHQEGFYEGLKTSIIRIVSTTWIK